MDYGVIADIFDEIYKTGALIVKPAVDFEIDRCIRDLESLSIPVLPAEYISFLKVANGVSWNGFEFFGTYQVTVKKSGYTLTDIVSFNDKRRSSKMALKNMLILGRFDDDIFVYNMENDKYQALDSLTMIEIETYDTFQELFVSYLTEYIEDDDFEDDDPEDDDPEAGEITDSDSDEEYDDASGIDEGNGDYLD